MTVVCLRHSLMHACWCDVLAKPMFLSSNDEGMALNILKITLPPCNTAADCQFDAS